MVSSQEPRNSWTDRGFVMLFRGYQGQCCILSLLKHKAGNSTSLSFVTTEQGIYIAYNVGKSQNIATRVEEGMFRSSSILINKNCWHQTN